MPSSSPRSPLAHPRILCVEDDEDISRLLTDILKENGFDPLFVRSATEMDIVLKSDDVDLLILDVMLPGEDGLSICRRLRATSSVPIIMVTARGEEMERVLGLETGADDYICKPFSSKELVARIRALLRRAEDPLRSLRAGARPLRFAGWCIDPMARELFDADGARIILTSVEFDLLLAFCRNPGQTLSREKLIELVHRGHAGSIERSIDVHISRIRQKIEVDPRDPLMIKTVRLGGYIFTPAVEQT